MAIVDQLDYLWVKSSGWEVRHTAYNAPTAELLRQLSWLGGTTYCLLTMLLQLSY